MRAFGVLVDEVQALIQDTSSGFETTVKNAINRAYRRIVAGGDWPSLRAEEAFTMPASGNFLTLPAYVDKVYEVFDLTNSRRLQPERHLKRKYVSTMNTSGTGYEWSYAGISAVAVQPSAATTISIKGDAGTDSGTQVRIMGRVTPTTTGSSAVLTVMRAENETTNGGSAATTDYSFAELLSISKDSDAQEDIIISDDGSTTFYAVLPMEEYTTRYPRIRIHYVPAAATSYTLEYQRYPPRFVSTHDAPLFPCGDVIVLMAAAELARQQKKHQQAMSWDMAAARAFDQLQLTEQGFDRGSQQAIPSIGHRRRYG